MMPGLTVIFAMICDIELSHAAAHVLLRPVFMHAFRC